MQANEKRKAGQQHQPAAENTWPNTRTILTMQLLHLFDVLRAQLGLQHQVPARAGTPAVRTPHAGRFPNGALQSRRASLRRRQLPSFSQVR